MKMWPRRKLIWSLCNAYIYQSICIWIAVEKWNKPLRMHVLSTDPRIRNSQLWWAHILTCKLKQREWQMKESKRDLNLCVSYSQPHEQQAGNKRCETNWRKIRTTKRTSKAAEKLVVAWDRIQRICYKNLSLDSNNQLHIFLLLQLFFYLQK